MKAQSTFEERLSRLEAGAPRRGTQAYKTQHLVQNSGPKRKLHVDMLAAGSLAGAVAGVFFALNIGLLYLVTLNLAGLYQLIMGDQLMAACLAGVIIAPIGFVMTQIFSRRNPRAWQFWIGYLAGVIAANFTDIEAYYYILTSGPV